MNQARQGRQARPACPEHIKHGQDVQLNRVPGRGQQGTDKEQQGLEDLRAWGCENKDPLDIQR